MQMKNQQQSRVTAKHARLENAVLFHFLLLFSAFNVMTVQCPQPVVPVQVGIFHILAHTTAVDHGRDGSRMAHRFQEKVENF